MKTKLISFIFILIFSVTAAFAQKTDNSKMSFALLGGINFQNLNGKASNGDKLTNDMILGFHLGVNVQMPIAPQFYFQPGFLFSTKGAKYPNGSSVKLSYLELPLNVVYKALVGNGKFMLGFGPYLAYAIMIKGGDYKAFDAGGNVFAGYELASGIFAQLNTQFGMVKINPDSGISGDKTSVKNTGFGLSIGYRF